MTSLLPLARQVEQLAGLGILVASLVLLGLSVLAWRRERSRKMAIVGIAYGFFALHGLVIFLERYLVTYGVLPFGWVELLEHASSLLVLAGLLAFFVALTRE